MIFRVRQFAFAVAAVAALLPFAGWAEDGDNDHDNDHELARELYEHGQIRSLADILRAVRQQNPGEIVGVELIPAGADWVYRFQIVSPDGRRTIVDVDAETAMPIDPDATP